MKARSHGSAAVLATLILAAAALTDNLQRMPSRTIHPMERSLN
jgi:hypothetical protein